MNKFKPVVTPVPPVHRPKIPLSLQKSPKWAFSFRYFRQIEHFGLDRSDATWFVSLLERLSELCKSDKAELFQSAALKQAHRYHRIEWGHRNVPIRRSDLDWLDADVLQNDEDFPIYQIQISKALGRIVGFWDPDSTIFYVVLLDPAHNIQPSKKYNYRVSDNYPLSCEYSSLLIELERVKKLKCKDPSCLVTQAVTGIPSRSNDHNLIIIGLEDDYIDLINELPEHVDLCKALEDAIINQL